MLSRCTPRCMGAAMEGTNQIDNRGGSAEARGHMLQNEGGLCEFEEKVS